MAQEQENGQEPDDGVMLVLLVVMKQTLLGGKHTIYAMFMDKFVV